MTDDIDYQRIAQLLIEFDAMTVSEFDSTGEPDALRAVEELYEEHGPFDLEWNEWAHTQPPQWARDANPEE